MSWDAGQDYERAHEELAKAANGIMSGGGPPGGGYGPPPPGYGPPQGYGGPPPPGYGQAPPSGPTLSSPMTECMKHEYSLEQPSSPGRLVVSEGLCPKTLPCLDDVDDVDHSLNRFGNRMTVGTFNDSSWSTI